jgi:hypothetical protein
MYSTGRVSSQRWKNGDKTNNWFFSTLRKKGTPQQILHIAGHMYKKPVDQLPIRPWGNEKKDTKIDCTSAPSSHDSVTTFVWGKDLGEECILKFTAINTQGIGTTFQRSNNQETIQGIEAT